jgi:hypothetical protein
VLVLAMAAVLTGATLAFYATLTDGD